MKRLLAYTLSIIFIFSNVQPALASELNDESVEGVFEQIIEEGIYYETADESVELEEIEEEVVQEEIEEISDEFNQYVVISDPVEQDVYNYMFANIEDIYGIFDDLLYEKNLNIRDAYIGMPFKVDTTDHGFDQYIFPVFIENNVVCTIFIEKHYYPDEPDGVFGMTLGDVFHDILTESVGNLYLFKFDGSTFAIDNSGIKEIYGYSSKADSVEVKKVANFSKNSNTIDISEELISFLALEDQKKNNRNIPVLPPYQETITLNVKWVGQDRNISDTCWAAALACIWEYHSGRLITVKEWCYAVHGNTCLNRGYCRISSPKEERAVVTQLTSSGHLSRLCDMWATSLCAAVKHSGPAYSYGGNTVINKEHAVVVYGYDYRGVNNIYYKLIDSNNQNQAYSLYTKMLYNSSSDYQYFINGGFTHYYYMQFDADWE